MGGEKESFGEMLRGRKTRGRRGKEWGYGDRALRGRR